jgi:hypothetical protein
MTSLAETVIVREELSRNDHHGMVSVRPASSHRRRQTTRYYRFATLDTYTTGPNQAETPMSKMRAVIVPEIRGRFRMEERELPEPGRHEVRVRVHACGVCHGDSVTVEGLMPRLSYPRCVECLTGLV